MTGALALLLGAFAAADSVRALTFEELHSRVLTAHPVARQARLLERIAQGKERVARGAFDPTINAAWDRKDLGGRRYFDYLDASLRFPTPFGVDVKVGYERATGDYAAPDIRTAPGGLLTAGLSIPLGQGWLTDERRTALARARAMRDYAAADRIAIVNELLSMAARSFGAWYEAWRRLALATEAEALAEFRLQAVRRRVDQGDAAAIDTTEAALEVQRRRVLRSEADLAWRNASLVLEGLMWDDGGKPSALPVGVVPSLAGLADDSASLSMVSEWIAEGQQRHPGARKADAKAEEARAERALAAQRVVAPDAMLRLSALTPHDAISTVDVASSRKVGASARIPLLYRKERGALEAGDAALDQATLERALVRRGIAVSIGAASNALNALRELEGLQLVAVTQARQLRDAEQRKFEAGESTLFLVNARDRAVIEEELKRISLEARRVSTRAELAVAIGRAGRLEDSRTS